MASAHVLGYGLFKSWDYGALREVRTTQHIYYRSNVCVSNGLSAVGKKLSQIRTQKGWKVGSTCSWIKLRNCSTDKKSGLVPEL